MHLTKSDPLKLFIAFGSISGRFGGRGQTDYCVANEMLCKLVAWYRRQRPDVAIATLDWHIWDDVGMAIRPETKHVMALAAIRFMPAVEGVKHLLDEIDRGCPESETMITDWRYYKLYFADEPAPPSECEGSAVAPTTSPDDVTQRFVLRMEPAPRDNIPVKLFGPTIILGDNPDARALAAKIQQDGCEVTVIDVARKSSDQAVVQLKQACFGEFAPHLFVMTGRDEGARQPLVREDWNQRRRSGITTPFIVCQQWIRQYAAAGTPAATLTAAVALGGDFGFSQDPIAPEGGAFSGLLILHPARIDTLSKV